MLSFYLVDLKQLILLLVFYSSPINSRFYLANYVYSFSKISEIIVRFSFIIKSFYVFYIFWTGGIHSPKTAVILI